MLRARKRVLFLRSCRPDWKPRRARGSRPATTCSDYVLASRSITAPTTMRTSGTCHRHGGSILWFSSRQNSSLHLLILDRSLPSRRSISREKGRTTRKNRYTIIPAHPMTSSPRPTGITRGPGWTGHCLRSLAAAPRNDGIEFVPFLAFATGLAPAPAVPVPIAG